MEDMSVDPLLIMPVFLLDFLCIHPFNDGNGRMSKAYDIVKASVDTKIGKFTKREIVIICPSISEKSVEAALKKLLDEGYVIKHGSGKNTFYSKNF